MRTTILAIVMLLAAVSAAPQDLEPVKSFEALLSASQEVTKSSTPVYFNKYRKLWAKRRFTISDVKYDVRKTDSLVTPVLGFVSYRLTTNQSALVETEEQARAESAVVDAFTSHYAISLRYSLRGGSWWFLDGEYRNESPPSAKFPITAESVELEPNALPNAVVKYWMPPR